MRNTVFAFALLGLVAGCTESGDLYTETDTSLAAVETGDPALSGNESDASLEVPREEKRGALSVGDPAPKFENLAGVDDKQHSLADYADAKAVALVFTCNSCPVAVAYEDRLVQLQQDYADKDVQLVAINVNNIEADKLPAMKTRAEEKGYQFPYLYDPSQQVARDYGAKVTPHVFLLDGKRRLAFVGPIDDSQDPEKINKQYLRDAIDAVLASNEPAEPEVKPFGCGIKYE